MRNLFGVRSRQRMLYGRTSANKSSRFLDEIPAEDLLGMIHYNTEVIDADRQGKSPYDFSETVTAEIRKIKDKIDQNSIL